MPFDSARRIAAGDSALAAAALGFVAMLGKPSIGLYGVLERSEEGWQDAGAALEEVRRQLEGAGAAVSLLAAVQHVLDLSHVRPPRLAASGAYGAALRYRMKAASL